MGAEQYLPKTHTLDALREAAAGCRGCDLWEAATQTVFGDGAARARLMLVGEQPGDREDVEGKPFVGPAGRILDEGLEAAGVPRSAVYLTNAVKHFRWVRRGKRRLHEKPNSQQVRACRPWLDAERRSGQGCSCCSGRPPPNRSWDRRSGSPSTEARSSPPRSASPPWPRCTLRPSSGRPTTRHAWRPWRHSWPTCNRWLRRFKSQANQ